MLALSLAWRTEMEQLTETSALAHCVLRLYAYVSYISNYSGYGRGGWRSWRESCWR